MTWRTSCVGLKGSRDGRRSERRRKNKIIHHVKIELPRAAPAALIPRKIKYRRRKGEKKTYVIVFLVCSRLQGRDPFFHFATGLCAEDERTERSDDLYFVQESINKQ